MIRTKVFVGLILSVILALGVLAFAVTFEPASFEAGDVLSAAALNDLLNANFESARVAIEANQTEIDANRTAIADLQVSGLALPFDGAADTSAPAFSVVNTTGRAIVGTSTTGIGVIGISEARGLVGVQGERSCAGTYAVGACATTGIALSATADTSIAVIGRSPSRGVVGTQGETSCAGTYAVGGCATTGDGVLGRSPSRGIVGIQGTTSCAGTYGVGGCATTGDGVVGRSADGRAGFFDGDVDISGTLTKGAGSFRIDHPLDPRNRFLSHSFVESPDMLNIYNGNVVLDGDGSAWVELPEWFEALNRDFRYQLTSIGAPGPDLHVAAEIAGNRFEIAGGRPGARVSWQVTGIRNDPYAQAHRIQVESWKPLDERGTLLHPEAYRGRAGEPDVAADRGDVAVGGR